MADAIGRLVDSILRFPGEFAAIAAESPEQAILLALGALLVGVSMVVFGALALGGVLDALFGGLFESGRQYPERRRSSGGRPPHRE